MMILRDEGDELDLTPGEVHRLCNLGMVYAVCDGTYALTGGTDLQTVRNLLAAWNDYVH